MTELEFENLIEENKGLVRAISRSYFLAGGEQDDLYQEGMIGLLDAIKNFDLSRGGFDSHEFKAFASVCIKRQILDAIKHANTQKNQALNNYVSFTQKNSDDEEFELQFNNLSAIGCAQDPESVILSKETNNELIKNLNKVLSAFEKEVLELYLQGDSQSQIAARLEKSVKQIDNTIQRIKTKARQIREVNVW